MKKRFPTFVAGMLTTALIGTLAVSAFAAAGQLTITVNPINVRVNGETFTPKDEQGNSVPVFAYNGTTYAPLRALAAAYGLEVGYDKAANMATVTDPDVKPNPNTTAAATDYSDWSAEEEAAYQEFKGMWEVEINDGTRVCVVTATYNGKLSQDKLTSYMLIQRDNIERFSREYIKTDTPQSLVEFYSSEGCISNVMFLHADLQCIFVGDARIDN